MYTRTANQPLSLQSTHTHTHTTNRPLPPPPPPLSRSLSPSFFPVCLSIRLLLSALARCFRLPATPLLVSVTLSCSDLHPSLTHCSLSFSLSLVVSFAQSSLPSLFCTHPTLPLVPQVDPWLLLPFALWASLFSSFLSLAVASIVASIVANAPTASWTAFLTPASLQHTRRAVVEAAVHPLLIPPPRRPHPRLAFTLHPTTLDSRYPRTSRQRAWPVPAPRHGPYPGPC